MGSPIWAGNILDLFNNFYWNSIWCTIPLSNPKTQQDFGPRQIFSVGIVHSSQMMIWWLLIPQNLTYMCQKYLEDVIGKVITHLMKNILGVFADVSVSSVLKQGKFVSQSVLCLKSVQQLWDVFYLWGGEADAWSTFLPWDSMVDINSQCFQVMPTVREERSMMTTVSTTRRRRYGGWGGGE